MPDDKHIMLTASETDAAGILDSAQASRNLGLLRSELGPEGLSDLLRPLLNELSWSADPDLALNNFERYVHALNNNAQRLVLLCRTRSDILHSLITVLGA
ncbi:MAG TPA: hypothetical protein VEI57_11355, partial [Nitrospirota bacterium]|nr:hypothetical protein [Nitrospirota bacterium]